MYLKIDHIQVGFLTAGQTQYGLTKAWYGNYNNQATELGGGGSGLQFYPIYDRTIEGSFLITSSSATTLLNKLTISTDINAYDIACCVLSSSCTVNASYTRTGTGSQVLSLFNLWLDTSGNTVLCGAGLQSNNAGTYTYTKTNNVSGFGIGTPSTSTTNHAYAFNYTNSPLTLNHDTSGNITYMNIFAQQPKNSNISYFSNVSVYYAAHIKLLAGVLE